MANLNPKLDKFTEGINKTTPSITENLSPKRRKNIITNSVNSVKSEICNKVDGAVNLITSLKTGTLNILKGIKDFDVDEFFEGPLDGLKDKLGNVAKSFESGFESFKNKDVNLNKTFNSQIDINNKQLTERYESAKIANQGFDNTLSDVKNLSNKDIRDINLNPNLNKSLKTKLCNQAENDLINKANIQKSINSVALNQDNLINKSNTLINNVKDGEGNSINIVIPLPGQNIGSKILKSRNII